MRTTRSKGPSDLHLVQALHVARSGAAPTPRMRSYVAVHGDPQILAADARELEPTTTLSVSNTSTAGLPAIAAQPVGELAEQLERAGRSRLRRAPLGVLRGGSVGRPSPRCTRRRRRRRPAAGAAARARAAPAAPPAAAWAL